MFLKHLKDLKCSHQRSNNQQQLKIGKDNDE